MLLILFSVQLLLASASVPPKPDLVRSHGRRSNQFVKGKMDGMADPALNMAGHLSNRMRGGGDEMKPADLWSGPGVQTLLGPRI